MGIKVKGKPVDISMIIYRIVDLKAKESGYMVDVSIVMRNNTICLFTNGIHMWPMPVSRKCRNIHSREEDSVEGKRRILLEATGVNRVATRSC